MSPIRALAIGLLTVGVAGLVYLGPGEDPSEGVMPAVSAQESGDGPEANEENREDQEGEGLVEELRRSSEVELLERERVTEATRQWRELVQVIEVILERNPSRALPPRRHRLARALFHLWQGSPNDVGQTIDAIEGWRRILDENPDDMVALVHEARIWGHVRQNVGVFGEPAALSEFQERLGQDDRFVRLLEEASRLRSYIQDHPAAFSDDEARSRVRRRFGADDPVTRAVEEEVPTDGQETSQETSRYLRQLQNDEFRRAIVDRLEDATTLGYPVVGAIRLWEQFAPLREDVSLQIRLLRQGGHAPFPTVRRSNPFRSPEVQAATEETETEEVETVEDRSEAERLLREVRDRMERLETILHMGDGELENVEEIQRLQQAIQSRFRRLDSSDALHVQSQLEELEREFENRTTVVTQMILETYVGRGESIRQDMQEALSNNRFDEVYQHYDDLQALVQRMREHSSEFGPAAQQLAETGRTIFNQAKQRELLREILTQMEITGIIQGPDVQLVIIKVGEGGAARSYHLGEELRDADGEPYEGLVISDIDAQRRVQFVWGDQSFSVPLKQPGYWVRHLEQEEEEEGGGDTSR